MSESQTKTTRSNMWWIILGVVLSCYPHLGYSQIQTGIQLLPPGETQVVNQGNKAVNFAIRGLEAEVAFSARRRDGDWANYSIKPGRSMTFKCNCERFEIWINTSGPNGEERSVRYTLETEERYLIAWSIDRGLWDVFHINK